MPMINFLLAFISHDYVNATVAGIVGLFIFVIYYKQKLDNKRDAANILLLELQNAERQIKQIKESLAANKGLPQDIFTMPNENWSKYSYLFVKDLERNEWDKISDFYNKCKLLDQAVEYNNSFFQKNEQEIRINTQRIIADYTKEYKDKIQKTNNKATKTKLQAEMSIKINEFINEYRSLNTTNPNAMYYPVKPIADANIYMSSLGINISLTSIGIKLKKISSHKLFGLL